MFLEMDGFDHAAIASTDFGALWATRNAMTASSWTIIELFRNPELLALVREEVETCMRVNASGRLEFDVDHLLRLPVLQAVYAETLRLRVHFYIVRMPDRVDMNIHNYIIPRRKVIVTSTTAAHMNPIAWATRANDEYPLDSFWPGRFLRYDSNGKPIFSTKGLEGSWIPYGGGPRQCPGRHFAKRHILLSAALMITLFDCEVSEEGKNVQSDFSIFGFGGGMSHAARKIPGKLRRRRGGILSSGL
jgi:cytochrome P450